MEFKREGRLWLPDRPRFIAGRKQSLLAVTNLSGFGSGGGPPILTLAGHGAAGAGATTIAVTVTIPAGSLIIVTAAASSNVTLSSVDDGGINTYAVDDNGTGNPCSGVASVANCVALSGATVTATFSASAATRSIAVYAVTNMALASPLDRKASATGTSTTPSATTAATTVNNTVVVGVLATTGLTSFTEDANFTGDDGIQSGSARTQVSHKTVNPTTTGAQTYAPTLGSSVTWRDLVAAYKGLS